MNSASVNDCFDPRFDAASLDALDRLVAGELDGSDRERLLSWLDRDPMRWKRCALAFLEAQTWEQAFALPADGSIAPASSAPPGTKPATIPAYSQNGHADSLQAPAWLPRGRDQKTASRATSRFHPAIVAALCLVAVALGAAFGRWSNAPVAGTSPETPLKESSHPVAPDVRESAGDAPRQLVATVAVNNARGDAGGITVQLPVVEPSKQSRPAQAEPAPIPEYVRERWRRQGWELQPERKYLPAKLADGSSVVVPVDQMNMKYIGRQVY